MPELTLAIEKKRQKNTDINTAEPHPPPLTGHTLPSPPALLSPTQHISAVYILMKGRGGGAGSEKGGTVPIRSLLNTFVSTINRGAQARGKPLHED